MWNKFSSSTAKVEILFLKEIIIFYFKILKVYRWYIFGISCVLYAFTESFGRLNTKNINWIEIRL